MTVLFDSSAWLEYFFGSKKGEKIQYLIEKENNIIISKINIFEVYNKILRELNREEAEKFTSFIIFKSTVDDFDIETIKLAAVEKNKLKFGMADAIILATALKYNATIYTSDSDFEKA